MEFVVVRPQRRFLHNSVGAAVAGIALLVVLVVLVSTSAPPKSSPSLDLRALTIAASTKVSSPLEEDPRVGPMFGKLIQLEFDCVVELKRALRGYRLWPDYDAQDKVEVVEVMLHRMIRDVGVDELPAPRLGGRRATFTIAAKKVQLLRHLIKDLPVLPEVDTEHAARFSVVRFDVVQVSHALDRIIAELQERNFNAVEPSDSAVGYLLDKIKRSKIDTSTPLVDPATWDDVSKSVGENIVGGPIQGAITSVQNGNSVVAIVSAAAAAATSAEPSSSSSSTDAAKQYEFTGTMDKQGNLVGTLSPNT